MRVVHVILRGVVGTGLLLVDVSCILVRLAIRRRGLLTGLLVLLVLVLRVDGQSAAVAVGRVRGVAHVCTRSLVSALLHVMLRWNVSIDGASCRHVTSRRRGEGLLRRVVRSGTCRRVVL